MFTVVLVICVLIAVGNLYVVLGSPQMGIGAVTRQMAVAEGGLEQLRVTLIVSAMVQVFMIALAFMLKARSPELGMAWALVMTVSTCESIFTGRKMWETVAAQDKDAAFPFHDSWAYRAWQVGFNVATIAACVYLLRPEG